MPDQPDHFIHDTREIVSNDSIGDAGDGAGVCGEREARIIEMIVDEINSAYLRVWEAVKERDPHL